MFLNITAFRFFKNTSFLAPASHHLRRAMHRPASAAFVEWEVETIIAMHSDFRLFDLLGISWDIFDVCFFSFFPFFCGSFFVFSLKIGKHHGKNGTVTETAETDSHLKMPSSLRRVGSCQTLRCEYPQYLQFFLWVRSKF